MLKIVLLLCLVKSEYYENEYEKDLIFRSCLCMCKIKHLCVHTKVEEFHFMLSFDQRFGMDILRYIQRNIIISHLYFSALLIDKFALQILT
jgi:hypothetical protein